MVEFSYVPSERERWLDHSGLRIEGLRPWWVPGGLLTLAGVVLSGVAASGGPAAGWAVVATAAGGALLIIPYVGFERGHRALARATRWERRITVSESGVRLESNGACTEVSWSRLGRITETGEYWRLDWDMGGTGLTLPKRAVPEADRTELARLLELAKRRAGT